jgi:hypothetical protein
LIAFKVEAINLSGNPARRLTVYFGQEELGFGVLKIWILFWIEMFKAFEIEGCYPV